MKLDILKGESRNVFVKENWHFFILPLFAAILCYWIVLLALSASAMEFSLVTPNSISAYVSHQQSMCFQLGKRGLLPVLARKAVLFLQSSWKEFSTSSGYSSTVKWESFAKRLLYIVEKYSAAGTWALHSIATHHVSDERLWPHEKVRAGFPCCNEEKMWKSQMPCRIPMTFW